MRLLVLLTLLAGLLLSGCSRQNLRIPATAVSDSWLTPGGDPAHLGSVGDGPAPPLELVHTVTLNAAPLQNLMAFDSTLILGMKNGRVGLFDLRHLRMSGRLKIKEAVEPILGAHDQGNLIVGLSLGKETLRCYDVRSGRLQWKRSAGLLQGDPVVADSSVYIVARFKHADRYRLRDGERVWRYNFDSQAHTTPALGQRLMIFGTDAGRVLAVDRIEGKEQWRAETDAAVFASPVIFKDRVYVASTDSTVRALRLEDGEELWNYRAGGSIRRSPAVGGGLVVFGAGDGFVYAVDAEHGSAVWKTSARSGISTSPLVVGEHVYFGSLDKHFYAALLASGQIVWQEELRGRVRTNPMVFGDLLMIGSEDKYIYVFKQSEGVGSD